MSLLKHFIKQKPGPSPGESAEMQPQGLPCRHGTPDKPSGPGRGCSVGRAAAPPFGSPPADPLCTLTPQRLHPEVEAVPSPCIWAGPRRTPINRAQLEVSCASLGVESAVTVGTGQASLLLEEGQQPRRDVPRSTESPESGGVLQQDWGQG